MSDMPRPRPPKLQKKVSRHGKVTWYVETIRGAPRIRIKGVFGSPEFEAAYQAAISHGEKPVAIDAKASDVKDSIGWMIALYIKSSAWTGLSKLTRDRRWPQLRAVISTSGKYHAGSITKKALEDGQKRREKPSQKRIFIHTMRHLLAWAMTDDDVKHLVKENYAKSIPVSTEKTAGYTPWSEEDIARYEARWPLGTQERVMLDVYAYTGLRRSDAARVGRQHVKDGYIHIVTEKSPTEVVIEILPPLAASLAAGPVGDLAFNVTRFGQPFSGRGLGLAFRRACKAAGLVGRSAHGLRKTFAIALAEAGGTERELDATLGWKDGVTSRLYTEKANRTKLAKAGMRKLHKNEPETSMRPPTKVAANNRK